MPALCIAENHCQSSADRAARCRWHSSEPIAEIVVEVARAYRVSPFDLTGLRQTAEIATPRQIAMALGKRLTDSSLSEIGRRFGRAHTTVLRACMKFDPILDVVARVLPEQPTASEWAAAVVYAVRRMPRKQLLAFGRRDKRAAA